MDWKKIIEVAAPDLFTSLRGPLSGAAQKQLSGVFLDKADGDIADIKKIIAKGDSDIFEKLKKAEQEFQIQMGKLDIDLKRINSLEKLADQKGITTMKEKTPAVLAVAVTLGFFSCLGALMFFEMPLTGIAPLQIMLGALGAAWGSIIAYYFGSSAGSARKDGIMAQKDGMITQKDQ